jgi:hypothetical protein
MIRDHVPSVEEVFDRLMVPPDLNVIRLFSLGLGQGRVGNTVSLAGVNVIKLVTTVSYEIV